MPMNWTVTAKRPHRKRERVVIPPAAIRAARAGTVHPKEWRCGLRCGLIFRYAHRHEIPPSQCHSKGAHEFVLCPAHRDFPICVLHSPSYADES